MRYPQPQPQPAHNDSKIAKIAHTINTYNKVAPFLLPQLPQPQRKQEKGEGNVYCLRKSKLFQVIQAGRIEARAGAQLSPMRLQKKEAQRQRPSLKQEKRRGEKQ